jgi:acetyltransferase-like isoleucine patch superfamily enzyme
MIYKNNKIGKNFFMGHYVIIRQDNVIGDNVSIGSYTEIAHDVIIEDDVRLHSRCFIPEYTILKRGCWIGPGVVMTNCKYPLTGDKETRGPTVGKHAIVGANCTLMPGVVIGDDAVIGAGSVVTKNVPNGEVWAGNPIKYLKRRKDILEYNK